MAFHELACLYIRFTIILCIHIFEIYIKPCKRYIQFFFIIKLIIAKRMPKAAPTPA